VSTLCPRTHNFHGAGPRGVLYDMPDIMSVLGLIKIFNQ
jgi:hypothetical protein